MQGSKVINIHKKNSIANEEEWHISVWITKKGFKDTNILFNQELSPHDKNKEKPPNSLPTLLSNTAHYSC